MKKQLYLCLLTFALLAGAAFSQKVSSYRHISEKTPVGFESEINEFLRQDSISFPPSRAWLFTGSSTIRKWDNLKTDFHEITLIHRGFGGSTMEALDYYTDYIVIPYKPAKIIVYEGDNDLAKGVTPDEFISQCDTFIKRVHEKLPRTKIYFLAIKPSPSRLKFMPVQDEANYKLKKLLRKRRKTGFIDIRPLMYDQAGNIRQDYFESDMLHITNACYKIWADFIKERLQIR